jgi:hypothetical protein
MKIEKVILSTVALLLLGIPVLSYISLGKSFEPVFSYMDYPIYAAFKTWGLALVLLLLTKALIFRRLSRISWKESIKLSFWVFITISFISFLTAGVFISGYGSPVGYTLLILPIILTFSKAIPWYGILALPIFVYVLGPSFIGLKDLQTSPTGYSLLMLINITTMYWLGCSLCFESLLINGFATRKIQPSAIFINIFMSFVLLTMFVPFIGPNPYYSLNLETELLRTVRKQQTVEDLISFMDLRRMSAPVLFGVKQNNQAHVEYDPSEEIDALQKVYSRYTTNDDKISVFDPSIGLAVIEDLLNNTTQKPAFRDQLLWLEGYYSRWAKVWEAARDGNIAKFNEDKIEWENWYSANPWPFEWTNRQADLETVASLTLSTFSSEIIIRSP